MLIKNNEKLLMDTIKRIYAVELIFTDLKVNEVKINYKDEKFILPYENERNYLRGILKDIYSNNEKKLSRIYHMVIREAEKTLKDNSQDIDKLIDYSIKLLYR